MDNCLFCRIIGGEIPSERVYEDDTCIAIRLAYKKNGRVVVQSGAGIVADSIPENEFTECSNKARAVVAALQTAEGGLR